MTNKPNKMLFLCDSRENKMINNGWTKEHEDFQRLQDNLSCAIKEIDDEKNDLNDSGGFDSGYLDGIEFSLNKIKEFLPEYNKENKNEKRN